MIRRRVLIAASAVVLCTPALGRAWQIQKSTGGFYFEVTLVHGYTSGFDAGYGGFGIASASASLIETGGNWADGTFQAVEAETCGWFANTLGSGRALGYPERLGSVGENVAPPDSGAGTVYAMAVNVSRKLAWIRNVTGGLGWAGTGITPNPATNVSGFDYSANLTPGPIYAFLAASQRNDTNYGACTINLGGSAFAGAVPVGYVAWGAADTLNSSDKSANLTLSGGNLSISTLGMGTSATYEGQLARSVGTH